MATYTVYIDPDGTLYTVLPRIWNNSSPITLSFVLSHGWTKLQRLIPVTAQDYDDVALAHLKELCIARGYTTRLPSDYKDSTVTRWRQDALDYIAHRDLVIKYSIEIQNKLIAGLSVPTLLLFKLNLPDIVWTLTLTSDSLLLLNNYMDITNGQI